MAKRPALFAVAATALMLLVAVPFVSMRLGAADASSDPVSTTTHQAYDAARRGLRPRLQRATRGRGERRLGQAARRVQRSRRGNRAHPRCAQRRRSELHDQPHHRRRPRRGLSGRLAAGGVHERPADQAARPGDPPGNGQERPDGAGRRPDGRVCRLRRRADGQAAAVHRDRRARLGAAADGRLPFAGGSGRGGADEPDVHRRVARGGHRRLPVRLVRTSCSASRPDRSRRSCRC